MAHQSGGKSKGLLQLKELGLRVPEFVVVPADKIVHAYAEQSFAQIGREVADILPATSYAVRSNALIEDMDTSAYAGQFETKTHVPLSGIEEAVEDIVTHAHGVLGGKLELFSVIIQEYIEPDMSGVTFTRSPHGQRQYVVECHHGVGADLVSGLVEPERYQAYWSEKNSSRIAGWETQKKHFFDIEQAFGHPQDIEWCVRGGEWYFLQSRPITTITKEEYSYMRSLEAMLKEEHTYRYVQNDVTDVIGTPFPLSMSLIELMYAGDGPIQRAYKRHGLVYTDTKMFHLFGREVYIDAEKEIHSLLPAYSILNKKRRATWSSLRGSIVTVKNIISMARLRFNVPTLHTQLVDAISPSKNGMSPHEWKDEFLDAYEYIFEANLAAATILQRYKTLVKKYPYSVVEMLTLSDRSNTYDVSDDMTRGLLGNSFDISDEHPFEQGNSRKSVQSKECKKWFDSLSQWKKTYLEKKCEEAVNALQVREVGRVVTVSYMHALRNVLKTFAKDTHIDTYKDLYYVPLQYILDSSVDNNYIQIEKQRFNNLPSIPTSQVIDSQYQEMTSDIVGVSPGIAQGELIRPEEMSDSGKGAYILHTSSLSPDLTKYFGSICGIYAESGGLLSHLAIMAREGGVPVVVGGDPSIFASGDIVEIDGTSGTVKVVMSNR